ncbi:MAG TPA: hypothetical protein VMA71_03295 [Alloacidobacterium sp.]|nr:hypothetical protein [Alloacidobacterium sp.]
MAVTPPLQKSIQRKPAQFQVPSQVQSMVLHARRHALRAKSRQKLERNVILTLNVVKGKDLLFIAHGEKNPFRSPRPWSLLKALAALAS